MYTNLHLFFTSWLFLLVVFHRYTHMYIDLLYLSFVVLCVGLYISYVHPRFYRFVLFDKEYKLTGVDKFMIDLFFHLGIFWFVYLNYSGSTRIDYKFLVAVFLLCLYSIMIKVSSVYCVKLYELFSVIIIASIMYVLIFL